MKKKFLLASMIVVLMMLFAMPVSAEEFSFDATEENSFIEPYASTYNASAAIAYADKWALSFNPAYPNYIKDGGDCANFVSQCIFHGGLPTDSVWDWDKSAWKWTYGNGIYGLYDYLGDKGYPIVYGATYSQYSPGDVIFTSSRGHVMLCVGKDSSGTPLYSDYSGADYDGDGFLEGGNSRKKLYGTNYYLVKMNGSQTPSSATININANGGTVKTSKLTVKHGSKCNLSPNYVFRNGYTLKGWNLYRPADKKWFASGKGWYTDAEISSKGYKKSVYIPNLSMTLDGSWYNNTTSAIDSFTFYAVWEPASNTVNINANGGTALTTKLNVVTGNKCNLFANFVKRDGYILKGWNLYRPADKKWFASGKGWYTDAEISAKGYTKHQYVPNLSMALDYSWFGNTSSTVNSFTFYAVWEYVGQSNPTPTPTPDPAPTPTPTPVPSVKFIDVKSDAYYATPVAWAVSKGVTSGTSATTFSPDNACTRGQAVTFLWRAAGKPVPKSSYNPFTDVKAGEYYYDAVLWAVENGITMGTSATTFSPDATCNRGQIVTFLYRAEGSPDVAVRSTFNDVESDAYYAKAVSWAVDHEVTTGTSATTFSPDSDCTRGQIVTFLYRAEN